MVKPLVGGDTLTFGCIYERLNLDIVGLCCIPQLDYVVTCAVCTRSDAGDIHIHKKKCQVSSTVECGAV